MKYLSILVISVLLCMPSCGKSKKQQSEELAALLAKQFKSFQEMNRHTQWSIGLRSFSLIHPYGIKNCTFNNSYFIVCKVPPVLPHDSPKETLISYVMRGNARLYQDDIELVSGESMIRLGNAIFRKTPSGNYEVSIIYDLLHDNNPHNKYVTVQYAKLSLRDVSNDAVSSGKTRDYYLILSPVKQITHFSLQFSSGKTYPCNVLESLISCTAARKINLGQAKVTFKTVKGVQLKYDGVILSSGSSVMDLDRMYDEGRFIYAIDKRFKIHGEYIIRIKLKQ